MTGDKMNSEACPYMPIKGEGIRCLRSALVVSCWRVFIRIRIYGIIGFSGFYSLVFDGQALVRIRLGGIFGCGEKSERGESKS